MISLHRSMHSSHMYTPGPAISFLTCFWLLPQNEHFSRSAPSPMRATALLPLPLSPSCAFRTSCGRYSGTAGVASRKLTVPRLRLRPLPPDHHLHARLAAALAP